MRADRLLARVLPVTLVLLALAGAGLARSCRAAPPPLRPDGVVGVELPRLDLDRATRAELEALPGIGPALAARMLTDRANHGPWRCVDELDRVRGIGAGTVERLRPLVRTGARTCVRSSAPAP